VWLGQAVLAEAKSLTLLLFSSPDEDEEHDFSNTWMAQDTEFFQRDDSAVVGALALSIKKQGAYGGVLPCALNSQNSSFFLRQLLCKLCIVPSPKLH